MLIRTLAFLALATAAHAQTVLCDAPAECPCPASLLHGGCANSVTHLSSAGENHPFQRIGGWLVIGPKQYPQPSVSNDQIILFADRLPSGSVALFFQGTTSITPVLFGDGLRCIGGTITRLGVRTVPPSPTPQPSSVILGAYNPTPLSVLGNVPPQGGERFYQVWYRNAAPFCTPATHNLTNAVGINWAP